MMTSHPSRIPARASRGARFAALSFAAAALALAPVLRAELERPNTYGQALVDQVMAANPEVRVIGIHGTPPGSKDQSMIASSNLKLIGEKDDDDDLAASTKPFKVIMHAKEDDPTQMEVLMPLKRSSGDVIGSLVLVYNYHPGDDDAKILAQSIRIRDGLQTQIQDVAALVATKK